MMQGHFRLGFAVFASSAVVLAAVACGDAAKGGDAKNPGSASGENGSSGGTAGPASSAPETAAASSGAWPPANGSSGSTTTTQLGDGGDLQGAKLGGKTHSETESAGDAGPKSTHGQSASEPGRTAKDIQAIVGSRRDEARACYDNAIAAHPNIEGDLDVKWVIDPQGNVTEPAVDTSKSSILEPSVGTCIIEVLKKIKFAASAKGYETRAHYPFNFHPKAGQKKDAGH